MLIARATVEDLELLKELIEAGTPMPVIDRTCPLSQTADAVRQLELGHAPAARSSSPSESPAAHEGHGGP